MLRYAILAPSCNNTQPWRFAAKQNEIRIIVDGKRWLKIADADKRELYISAGCALENLLIATEHFGYGHQVFYGEGDEAAIIMLIPGGNHSSIKRLGLYRPIRERCTNRKMYHRKPISRDRLKILHDISSEDGLVMHTSDSLDTKQKAKDLIARADIIRFSDPAFREELGYWLGQGVFGSPRLTKKITQMLVTHIDMGKNRAEKDGEILMSAPVLGVISSEKNDRKSQVKAGQVLERVWLMATAMGFSLQPLSPILEIPELKEEVTKLIPGSDAYPQQVFRLGYADPVKMRAPRRHLKEFVI